MEMERNPGWGKVASGFAIPSLGMVPPDQRTEALRATMRPLLSGPLAKIMDDMCRGAVEKGQVYIDPLKILLKFS